MDENNRNKWHMIEDAKIGRHSSNTVIVLEESVSRFHAQLLQKDKKFYLKDVGSTTGSFIKIKNSINLKEYQTIEMGSNQFQVQKVSLNMIVLKIIEGPDKDQKINVDLKQPYSIGRK